jgi:peptidoglycan/LPS O-acetylase OafA/YrhL
VGHDPFYGVFSFGHAGVDFFFVLSGFIIFFVHQKDVGQSAHVFRYAWRRVTRIYPIYWLVTLLAIGMAIAGHHTDLTVWRVVASLSLLPQADDPIVGVAWTLEHEVIFYGVFAALILNARIGVMLCAAWLVLVFVSLMVSLPGVVLPFLASAYHLDFFLGMASAWLVLQDHVPLPRLLALIGVSLFVLTGVAENSGYIVSSGLADQMFFGFGSSALITGIATAERRGAVHFGRTAEFFGGMSYSLYLVHTTFIGLTAHVLMSSKIIQFMPGPIVALLCIAVALVGGAALYALIERPLLASLQKLGADRRTRISAKSRVGASSV